MTSDHPRPRWKIIATLLLPFAAFAAIAAALHGMGPSDARSVITVWHPLRPPERALLNEEFRRFEAAHPEVRLRGLYKDIEELRSAYQAAALAGSGPELVYGPSDVLDTFQTMGILQDMGPWFTDDERYEFIKGALTFLPDQTDPTKHDLVQVGDRFGTHLALVYNRNFVPRPPTSTDEMVTIALANTIDEDRDGRNERYGLVWSFSEPYFAIPFLTGFGAWIFEETSDDTDAKHDMPALNTPEAISAFRFIQSLRDVYHVAPAGCDYELADSLFKTGRAAMIINGDWSWSEYLNIPEIDAAVALLPIVSATGKPMQTMIAPKGFSLNANTTPDNAKHAMAFVRHMTSAAAQQRAAERSGIVPVRVSVYEQSLSDADPTYRISREQLENGRLMPVTTELRGVWDAMRPNYQALLGGMLTPEAAAEAMQREALENIALMDRRMSRSSPAIPLQAIGLLLVAVWFYWQRKNCWLFLREWRGNRMAYLCVLPTVIVMFALVVFPFAYNVALSFSNMSLNHFRDWQIIGWQNYAEVFTDPKLWRILLKTIVWTIVSVSFHTAIGLVLAVALNGPIFGRKMYRLFLIIPWAVPAYITALTWRGMFNYEYGAVNLILIEIQKLPPIAWLLQLLNLTAPVNWLGDTAHAFQACLVANIWLGFPFMMIVALGGMQGIPQELYEAARVDRASRWQQFRHITLPLLKPVLLPAVTLGTLWTFNNLNVIWLVSNGGEPQDATHILVSHLYKAVFNLYRYGYGAALSMVMFFLLMGFALAFLNRNRATESVYR